VAIVALYLYHLNGYGVIPPDEPRYAAIGRSMAHNGDWITPTLWGAPWFEKPPLLYWMTAAGALLGLGPELSGRLPVALVSIGFLFATFVLVRREFGNEAAFVSTVLLATSAGWLAYSQLCLTDLPLSVFFSLAVLLALPLLRRELSRNETYLRVAAVGVCLGLGTLAKGLVPLALAVPFLWFFRRWWRDWWIALVACLLMAGPWYAVVYKVNGYPFVYEFFIRHHFERLYSASLQHVQPWFYYLPVLLAGLFPWTPLLGLLVRKKNQWDRSQHFLLATSLFGLFLFSLSLNKLPGYILPLFPSIFVLIGSQYAEGCFWQIRRAWFICCACLVATIPLLAYILPHALAAGRLSSSVFNLALKTTTATEVFYVALPVAVVILARRSWTPTLLVLSLVAGAFYLKVKGDPAIDESVSARVFWHKIQPVSENICQDWVGRDWLYGLQFYRGSEFPSCGTGGGFKYALRPNGHRPPLLQPLGNQ
jgi:4-amino-4-deoxy-L-arabinose transferase-like glycosyltransferase